ncbi:hypothetical protein ABKN59_010461 [Abortiporus biennis]
MAIGKWNPFQTSNNNTNNNLPPSPPPIPVHRGIPVLTPADAKHFGLENFGNTCYANSVLQALYFCNPFRDLILQYPDPSAPPIPIPSSPQPSSLPSLPLPPPPPSTTRPKSHRKFSISDTPLLSSPLQPSSSLTTTNPSSNASNNSLTSSIPIPDSPPTLLSALRSLYVHISSNPSDKGTVAPKAFIEKLKELNELFRTSQHQDAHEFLNYLLNRIVEEMEDDRRNGRGPAEGVESGNVEDHNLSQSVATLGSSTTTIPPHSPAAALSVSKPSSTTTASTPHPHPNPLTSSSNPTTLVHRLFEGTLTSETRCLSCETVSSRDESFLDLSIDIEQNTSVTSCLKGFSASEMLCQRNKFFCEGCCGLMEAEKRMKIKTLPNILALHLKRFKYQEETGKYIKLAYRVAFPLELRLFNTVDDAEDPDRLYELFGVVVHIGSGPHHGHYVSIIKARGIWYLFDDDSVEVIKESDISRYYGDSNSGSAYVLYYQAVDMDLAALGLRPPPTIPEEEGSELKKEKEAVEEYDGSGGISGLEGMSSIKNVLGGEGVVRRKGSENVVGSPMLPPGLSLSAPPLTKTSNSSTSSASILQPLPETHSTSPSSPDSTPMPTYTSPISSPLLSSVPVHVPSAPQLKLSIPSTSTTETSISVSSNITTPATATTATTAPSTTNIVVDDDSLSTPTVPPPHTPSKTTGFFHTIRNSPSIKLRGDNHNHSSKKDYPPIPPIPTTPTSPRRTQRPNTTEGGGRGGRSGIPIGMSTSLPSSSVGSSSSGSGSVSNGSGKDKEKEKEKGGTWFARRKSLKTIPSAFSGSFGKLGRRASEAGLSLSVSAEGLQHPHPHHPSSPLATEHKKSTPDLSSASSAGKRLPPRPSTAGASIGGNGSLSNYRKQRPKSAALDNQQHSNHGDGDALPPLPPLPSNSRSVGSAGLSSSSKRHTVHDPSTVSSSSSSRHGHEYDQEYTNGHTLLSSHSHPHPHHPHSHPQNHDPEFDSALNANGGVLVEGVVSSSPSTPLVTKPLKRSGRKLSLTAGMLGFGRKDKDKDKDTSPRS